MSKNLNAIWALAVTLSLVVGCGNDASAQYYEQSAGIRLSRDSGVTFKKFITEEQAMELIVGGIIGDIQFTGLYEFHRPLQMGDRDRFFIFYGVGGQMGLVEKENKSYVYDPSTQTYVTRSSDSTVQFSMGVHSIAGVEYRWMIIPVVLGVDIKPSIDFVGMRDFDLTLWDVAFTVKYTF